MDTVALVINWGGKAVKTRELRTTCSRFKLGDFLLFQGEMTQVIAVQPGCPAIENLRHGFTMVTLQTRDGRVIPARSLGYKTVHRTIR